MPSQFEGIEALANIDRPTDFKCHICGKESNYLILGQCQKCAEEKISKMQAGLNLNTFPKPFSQTKTP
jgi:hypothetical protein